MNKLKFLTLVLLSVICRNGIGADVDNSSEVKAAFSTFSKSHFKALTWIEILQKKYSLTDLQTKMLLDSKMPDPHLAQAAELAKLSNKSLEEILKMRLDQKMGWGQIAKQLNIHPSELGKAVSSVRKEQSADRKKERDSKKQFEREKQEADKKERVEKRQKAQKDREAKKAENKLEHAEKRETHGKSEKIERPAAGNKRDK